MFFSEGKPNIKPYFMSEKNLPEFHENHNIWFKPNRKKSDKRNLSKLEYIIKPSSKWDKINCIS